MKRQKEVKDLSTTRLREGDAVLAAFAGSTRATCVFFSNFGVAYTCRIIDVPASTGYGEPIQRLFKLKDGEKVVAALSLDPRVDRRRQAVGEATPTTPPPVHAVAVTSDGYALRFGLEPLVEPSTRAGRRFARPAEGAEVVGVAQITGERNAHRRHGRGARPALQGRRGELPVRARARASSSSSCGDDDRVLGFIASTGDRDLLTVETTPRRRADDQHGQVRGDRPRRQGPRAAPARPVHPHRLADAGSARHHSI